MDLLIEVDVPTSPWFPGGLVADLEALLGCRVDVVESDALGFAGHPAIRERRRTPFGTTDPRRPSATL